MTVLSSPAVRPARPSLAVLERVWRHRALYLFILPFAALSLVFGLWPIVQSITLAFTASSTALSDAPRFVGLDNFRTVLADPMFHSSLIITVAYTAVSVVLNVGVALGLAMLLAHPVLRVGRSFFKLAMFLPVITPEVASFIVWKWMFNLDFGAVNGVLLSLGLPPFAGVTQPIPAFITLVIVELWHHVGLYTLIFLTNLQLLDKSLSEAAAIDGASRWQNFRYVVLPQLRPAITINGVYAVIEFLKTFTVSVVITKGGPNFASNFLSYYAYTRFDVAKYGEAMAMATILFVLVAVLALGTMLIINRGSER